MNKNWLIVIYACLSILIWPASLSAVEVMDIDIHGLVSQGYLNSTDNNYLADTRDGTFEFTEVALNCSKEFDKLRIGAQILARDLGEFGNNEVELDWAMGDYSYYKAHGVRVGKIKMPMGLYNQERDIDMLRLPILLPSSVYDEGKRDFSSAYQGLGLYGEFDSANLGALDYEVYYGSVDLKEDSIYIKGTTNGLLLGMFSGSTVSDERIKCKYTAGAAFRWIAPIDGLRSGITYNVTQVKEVGARVTNFAGIIPGGPVSAEAVLSVERTNWVASIEYLRDRFTFITEYSLTEIKTDSGIVANLIPVSGGKRKPEGYYLQAAYRINDLFSAGIYYSVYYFDKNDKDGNSMPNGYPKHAAWQKEIVPAARFDLTRNFVVKAEVHFVDGTALVYGFNNPGGTDKNWILYALKATYSF